MRSKYYATRASGRRLRFICRKFRPACARRSTHGRGQFLVGVRVIRLSWRTRFFTSGDRILANLGTQRFPTVPSSVLGELQVLERMAPQVGLEPTTLRLTAGCSAIELLRSVARTLANASLCLPLIIIPLPYDSGNLQTAQPGLRITILIRAKKIASSTRELATAHSMKKFAFSSLVARSELFRALPRNSSLLPAW